jgi:trimeric autotransporter adhesin
MKFSGVFLPFTLIALTLPVSAQFAPDFRLENNSGSSLTINPGEGADFSFVLTPVYGFSGTVNLNCAITPVVRPAPTCITTGSSLQLTYPLTKQWAATMATNGASSAMPCAFSPPEAMPLAFTLIALGLGWFWLRNRKCWMARLSPAMALGLAACMSCGGSSRTPAGTYTMTVTAVSGSLSHAVILQITVT